MGLLDFLGVGNKSESIQEFIEKGAIIIDVRSPGEFSGGHIKGSKNIPLNEIGAKINEIKKLNNDEYGIAFGFSLFNNTRMILILLSIIILAKGLMTF